MRDDIGETRDVTSEQPQVAADLERRLDAWQASVPIYPTHVPVRDVHSLRPQPSGHVLELRARRDGRNGQRQMLAVNLGSCERFDIGSGDRVEFDLLIAPGSETSGLSIELRQPGRQNRKGRLRGD